MRRPFLLSFVVGSAGVLALAGGCDSVETTGGQLITFQGFAAGPLDANGGQLCGNNPAPIPLTTTSLDCWQVTITGAFLQIGAVYLIQGQYSATTNSECVIPDDLYCGQLPGGTPLSSSGGPGIDLLCPDPYPFTVNGNGQAVTAGVGEIWLTGGQPVCSATIADGGAGATTSCSASPDINSTIDTTPVVTLAGYACPPDVTPCNPSVKEAINFTASVTIQMNRVIASNPALPGDNPICEQKIVATPLNLPLFQGGNLYVRADPRGYFSEFTFGAPGHCPGRDVAPIPPSCPVGCITPDCSDDSSASDAGVDAGSQCGGYCCGFQQTSAAGETPVTYAIPDTNSSPLGSQLFGGIRSGTLSNGATVYSYAFTAPDRE